MSADVHTLTVVNVVEETAEACSFSFEVPEEAAEAFAYRPGQFLTIAVPSDQTGVAARCYSLSSSPESGDPPTITVKRTADGYASNWLCDNIRPGDTLQVLAPEGIFTPKNLDHDLLLFAGGSGVTPIISIARYALKAGDRKIVVFYANRDEDSVIFANAWSELARAYPERLQVIHWLESVQGLPTAEQLHAFAAAHRTYEAFVCGPAEYMKMVMTALRELDFPRERRHQEKFVSLGGNPFGDELAEAAAKAEIADAESDEDDAVPAGPAGPVTLEVELDGEQHSFDDWDPKVTLLEHLESKGIKAPFSCREGECSACAVRLLEGEVRMDHNDVLEDEDLDEGIRLGCQSHPLTEKVSVTYS
ncbi:MAG TPA: ferredoxin--NADP reductase [Aeromicrobium sp.]|nr:ferredoxin--NADP reductase [Aeromicrobium sp.]